MTTLFRSRRENGRLQMQPNSVTKNLHGYDVQLNLYNQDVTNKLLVHCFGLTKASNKRVVHTLEGRGKGCEDMGETKSRMDMDNNFVQAQHLNISEQKRSDTFRVRINAALCLSEVLEKLSQHICRGAASSSSLDSSDVKGRRHRGA